MTPLVLALLSVIAFLAYATQTVTGFGGGVIALALGAHLLPLPEMVALLIPMSIVQAGGVLLRDRDRIEWGLLFKLILPVMGLGTALGLLVVDLVEGPLLKRVYGVLVLGYAIRELILLGRVASESTHAPPTRGARLAAGVGTLGAGVVHGIYACGGPLLVYAVDRLQLDKGAFRTTLLSVFLSINLVLVVVFCAKGRLHAAHLAPLFWLLLTIAASVLVGEWAHARIDQHRFKVVVYLVLVLCGVTLLV